MTFLYSILFCFWMTQSAPARVDEPRPLPELDSFLKGVRQHLESDRMILSRYTYLERTTFRQLEGGGTVKKTEERVYEVYPSLDEDLTYRKLVSRDGKALSAEEIEKLDREFDKKSQERLRKLENESLDDKRKREAKEAEEKRKEGESIDEAFRLFKIAMIGRRQIEGQDAIGLSFEPRPDYRPKTKELKILSKVRGTAWFGETDFELTRIEAELNSTLSFGMGVLAKLNQGAHMVFQRRKVNGEIWLPSEAHFTGNGRILMFKGFRIDVETVFSDYKKFSVETSVTYGGEKKP
jgi:hypothetical protein